MKQIIFKGQFGWYILANNYKDKSDIGYVNLYFPNKDEPLGNDKDKKWIDILNAQFTCYKGKIGLSIWEYKETISPKESANLENKVNEFIDDNNIPSEIDISSDNLPFY